MKHRVVYIAHRLNSPTREGIEKNRADASKWVGWLAREFDIAPIADWIVLTGQWDESLRERGLAIDLALIERADEVWLVGPRVSEDMSIEAAHAMRLGKPVHDLTGLGSVSVAEENSGEQRRYIAALLAGKTETEALESARAQPEESSPAHFGEGAG
ncbi:MAG TPA: hypothetical protein VGK73_12450 [Polyangiaceae bacterium]